MGSAIQNTNFKFDNQIKKYTGKVRDVYHFEQKLVMIVSDRISAFDVVLLLRHLCERTRRGYRHPTQL